jgi:hypothetical protein
MCQNVAIFNKGTSGSVEFSPEQGFQIVNISILYRRKAQSIKHFDFVIDSVSVENVKPIRTRKTIFIYDDNCKLQVL